LAMADALADHRAALQAVADTARKPKGTWRAGLRTRNTHTGLTQTGKRGVLRTLVKNTGPPRFVGAAVSPFPD